MTARGFGGSPMGHDLIENLRNYLLMKRWGTMLKLPSGY
jgi:hypothetical protein